MPLPPKGDPRHSLRMASRCCWVIGIFSLLAGTCAGATLGLRGRAGVALIGAAFSFLFYGGIGAAYVVFAIFLKKRRLWAVIAALSVTSIGCALVLCAAAMLGIFAVTGTMGPGLPRGFSLGILAFYLLIAAALGQMVYYLIRSLSAIKLPVDDEGRGFEVLPAIPAPITPSNANDPPLKPQQP